MRTSQKIGLGALALIAVATVVAIKNPMHPSGTTFTSSASNEPDIMPAAMRTLSSTITLQGAPCGDVVVARNVGDDIVGTCTNGLAYRLVHVKGGYLLQRGN
jgi:hypothetical protein